MSGVYNVTQNCDGLESCTRNIAIETGGVVGGWAGGTAGAAIAGGFIALIGVSSAPIVMVIVGIGAAGFGILGAGAGKDVFESFYEMSKLDEFLDRVESRVEKKIPQEIEDYIIESRFNNFSINASF